MKRWLPRERRTEREERLLKLAGRSQKLFVFLREQETYRARKWRVLVRAKVSRLVCPTHGVLTEAVPWAAPGSTFTLDFEDLVAWLAREMNKTAVTKLVHIAWVTVGRIIERVVGRKLNEDRLGHLYVIGIDEVSYRKGHKYLSVIADHVTGDPVWIAEGRSRDTVCPPPLPWTPRKARYCARSGPMGKRKRRVFTAEFKAETVRLCQLGGNSIAQVARDLDLTETALREWVKRAEVDAGKGPSGVLTSAEHDELKELRKRVKRLEMEREILKNHLAPAGASCG
jgi:transposase-like protein